MRVALTPAQQIQMYSQPFKFQGCSTIKCDQYRHIRVLLTTLSITKTYSQNTNNGPSDFKSKQCPTYWTVTPNSNQVNGPNVISFPYLKKKTKLAHKVTISMSNTVYNTLLFRIVQQMSTPFLQSKEEAIQLMKITGK